jgi:hypothetical protein
MNAAFATIDAASKAAAEFLAAETAAVEVEMVFQSITGRTMYATFNRCGLKSVSHTPAIAD